MIHCWIWRICFIRWKVSAVWSRTATPQGQNDGQMKSDVLRWQWVWDRLMSYVWVWRITANRQMETVTMLKPLRNPMSQRSKGTSRDRGRPAGQSHLRMTYSSYCTATHGTHVTSLTVKKTRQTTRPFKLLKYRIFTLRDFHCTEQAILLNI